MAHEGGARRARRTANHKKSRRRPISQFAIPDLDSPPGRTSRERRGVDGHSKEGPSPCWKRSPGGTACGPVPGLVLACLLRSGSGHPSHSSPSRNGLKGKWLGSLRGEPGRFPSAKLGWAW